MIETNLNKAVQAGEDYKKISLEVRPSDEELFNLYNNVCIAHALCESMGVCMSLATSHFMSLKETYKGFIYARKLDLPT